MDQIKQIEAYVRDISSKLDEMHDYRHFKTVADNAALIARVENCDKKAAYVAGMLHDVGRIRYNGKWINETKSWNHGVLSARMAEEFLNKIKFDKTEEVCTAIRFHVRPKTQRTKLARILWDADKLSYYSTENGEKLIKFLVERGMSERKSRERLRYDWSFYYWLFYTKTAKTIALDFLSSIGEKVKPIKGTEWKAPSVLRNNETPFSEVEYITVTDL